MSKFIEDFYKVAEENLLNKFGNIQQTPNERVEVSHRLYDLLQKKNIQTRPIEKDSEEEVYPDPQGIKTSKICTRIL